MNILTSQTRLPAKASTRRLLRRISSAGAVLAVVAAAVGLPVIAPETTNGASSVVAIARADCPPDCGGNPGGGNPSGPPGGGTEFVPPSMPAMPSYEPGRGQPPLDQNNGISIYNSNTPQPSQAAQPSQAPVQNQNGSYNRAANGEQQPNNYQQAPNNQQINSDWQQLSDQLNNQTQEQPGQQQPAQNNGQQDQSQNNQQDKRQTCESVEASVRQQFPADLFGSTEEAISQAQQQVYDELNQESIERKRSGEQSVAVAAIPSYPNVQAAQIDRYYEALAKAVGAAGIKCPTTNSSGPGNEQANKAQNSRDSEKTCQSVIVSLDGDLFDQSLSNDFVSGLTTPKLSKKAIAAFKSANLTPEKCMEQTPAAACSELWHYHYIEDVTPVSIPCDYVGDYSDQSRHDFCSVPPLAQIVLAELHTKKDTPAGVDFRASCARHDMCYDYEDANPGLDDPGARFEHMKCNSAFFRDLLNTCAQKIDPSVHIAIPETTVDTGTDGAPPFTTPPVDIPVAKAALTNCYAFADIYYSAVVWGHIK